MTIENYRVQIDEIDDRLLKLLNERAQLAVHISALKAEAEIPARDTNREREVVNRALQTNGGPLDDKAVTKIFSCIINETRRAQTYVVNKVISEIKKTSD